MKIEIIYFKPKSKIHDVRIFNDSDEFVDWFKRQLNLEPETHIENIRYIES